jgi:hypothetical protein
MGKPDDSGIAFVRSFVGFRPRPWSLPAVAGCRLRSGAPYGRVGKRHRGWGKMSSCRWEGQELRDERCYSGTENAEPAYAEASAWQAPTRRAVAKRRRNVQHSTPSGGWRGRPPLCDYGATRRLRVQLIDVTIQRFNEHRPRSSAFVRLRVHDSVSGDG